MPFCNLGVGWNERRALSAVPKQFMASSTTLLPTSPEHRTQLIIWRSGLGLTLGDDRRALDMLNDEMGRGLTIRGIPVQSLAGRAMRQQVSIRLPGIAWTEMQGYVQANMNTFLQDRGITDMWLRDPSRDIPCHRAVYYQFLGHDEPIPPWVSDGSATQSFAGSYWQLLLALSCGGGRLRSFGANTSPFDRPSVCCSPMWVRAEFFAWATNVFGDGLLHGLMLDIAVDSGKLDISTVWGRPGWLTDFYMPASAVWLLGIWVMADKPVPLSAPRFDRWIHELEVVGQYVEM